MVYSATVYRVMIASPEDVSNERRIARVTVHEWNAVHSQDRLTVLVIKDLAAHDSLHKRITDDLHDHDTRIKKLEEAKAT